MSATLIPSNLTMNQTLDMTLYLITDYVLENSTSAKGGIVMTIRTRLTYNCAHLRSTKESLIFEYFDIYFL